MRSIFIAWLAVISPWFVYGQFNSPNIPNAVGFELPMGNSSITISIGEPLVTTLTSASSVITQGYLQPIDRVPCTGVEFAYYPNPTKEFIIIEPKGCDDQIEWVQIIDLWGRVMDTVTPKADNMVRLDDLSQGLYVFKVKLQGGTTGNFSAIKISN